MADKNYPKTDFNIYSGGPGLKPGGKYDALGNAVTPKESRYLKRMRNQRGKARKTNRSN